MDNQKQVVLCPFCDKEQHVEAEKEVAKCVKCGSAFNADIEGHAHPEEFWANPDTSARF
jgi:uncharacterized CHY-type Zn-finger protein